VESGAERLVLCKIHTADNPRILFSLIIAADFTWTITVAGQKVCLTFNLELVIFVYSPFTTPVVTISLVG